MYDKSTIEKCLRLVKSGMSLRQVSEAMGGEPSASTIRMWAIGKKPTGKRTSRKYYSIETKLEALDRVSKGENYLDVARDVGCAGPTLLMWRRMRDEKGVEALRTSFDAYLEESQGTD